jgi:hypothetical protein
MVTACRSLEVTRRRHRALKTEDRAKIKKIFGLIDLLTRLLLKNPDGECKWPPTPVAEGKW